MKAETFFHRICGLILISFLVSALALPVQLARAEDIDNLETSGTFSREQLAQMLAPIALYPDTLLSQVLMASTYPIEVVEADRWVAKNPGLTGEALDAALLDMDWDPSVKAMCHFPSILSLMSERIGETTDIGNAFLAQEADVLGMVQELRARARAQNHLDSDARQKVIVENDSIVIVPTDPKVIYVSYYDPAYIYGPWWYPAYPPYYWGPPGVSIGLGISYWPGFYFGFAFGGWSSFDWHNHYIYVDSHRRPRFVRHDRWRESPGRWIHAPGHRRGVVYRDASTARRFNDRSHRSREFDRDTHRVPEHRGQGADRRFDDRNRINSDNRREDRRNIAPDRHERQRIDRDNQERERVDRDKQNRERVDRGNRERADRDQQERERIDRGRQNRERVDTEKRKQQHLDSGTPERDRSDRVRRAREQVESNRQGRDRVETERKERDRGDGNQQRRQQLDREKKERDRIESEQQQQRRDNSVSPGDGGRRERPSNDGGRDDRHGSGGDGRDRGRSDDGGRGHGRR